MIERRDVKPGLQFTLKEWGYSVEYVVMEEDEVRKALGNEYLKWINRLPTFVACKNISSNLTQAKHIDIICREGRISTSTTATTT